ncbi:hypothetical protein KS4_29580 [Poriferisphaera corsica]|uniref:Uncharacterized protein n=1 Tax=Poriferisphaera corsica TaxID=2528020 RepID=A0A517YXC6_9BACT|nr:hypothetical protein [Poriferisphaera corsica]QDU34882.1 hypothetical protein KS4_29580 [Poriferisphaera corsica]
MNRTQLACYTLLASTFILTAILVVVLTNSSAFQNTAEADVSITKRNVTYLTAQIRNGEDGLFVLDGPTGKLAIYRTDSQRKNIELLHREDVNELFAQAMQGRESTDDADTPRRRRSR